MFRQADSLWLFLRGFSAEPARPRFGFAFGIGVMAWCLLFPGVLQAQAAAVGMVTGHVRGPGGVSVPGATVLLVEKRAGEQKETWTDLEGNYTLSGVNPGTYVLKVSLVGFQDDVRDPVPVSAGESRKVNVALVIAGSGGAALAIRQGPSGGADDLPNLESLPPEIRDRLSMSAIQGGGRAEGAGGAESNLRFSENPASGVAPQGEPQSSEAEPSPGDAAASAANSFLLSGSTGRAHPRKT